MRELIRQAFLEKFGTNGEQYASSGRINLIGEHTDYNGGFVFPGAIDKCIIAEIQPNGLGEKNGKELVRAYSLDVTGENNYVEFGLNEADAPKESWARYIFGVCREIAKRGGVIKGFDTVVAGNVPLGAGMSSSAALESTYAFALNTIFNLGIDKFELARIGQSTEHNYCGVKCGIMDQFASVFGKEGSLIRLDCRSLEYEYFPFNPKGYKLVLLDTVVKHELASSAYNKRRESCERAAKAIRENGHPHVEFLRDATMQMLDEVKNKISAEDYMRAEYVIGEVQRVLDVCDALGCSDYETVGAKMYETHYGMSKLYEVSCAELDYLNDLAKECGVTGSRVMGGGFGGCTINLVKDELYDSFIAIAKTKYVARFGHEPKVYDVVISNGSRKL
ncbi:MAG: galactokinase [Bacteroidales bacterium]